MNDLILVPRNLLSKAADKLSDMGQSAISEPIFRLLNVTEEDRLRACLNSLKNRATHEWASGAIEKEIDEVLGRRSAAERIAKMDYELFEVRAIAKALGEKP